MFIYTLLGMSLFAFNAKFDENGNVDSIHGTEKQINFDNFFNAFVTVFIILTNDGWSSIYYDYYRSVGPIASTLYFVTLIIIGQKVLLNLFLAILLNKFDDVSLGQEEKQAEKKRK